MDTPGEDPLAYLEQQMQDEPIIESAKDALHLFYAVTSAIDQLGATDLMSEMLADHDWYRQLGEDPSTFWAGFDPSNDDDFVRMVDRIADFTKDAAARLGQWMDEHDLTDIRLWCHLPCHDTFVPFSFTARDRDAA